MEFDARYKKTTREVQPCAPCPPCPTGPSDDGPLSVVAGIVVIVLALVGFIVVVKQFAG